MKYRLLRECGFFLVLSLGWIGCSSNASNNNDSGINYAGHDVQGGVSAINPGGTGGFAPVSGTTAAAAGIGGTGAETGETGIGSGGAQAGAGGIVGPVAGIMVPVGGTTEPIAGTMTGTGGTAEPIAGTTVGTGGTGGTDADGGEPLYTDEVNVAVEGSHSYDTFTQGASAPEYAEGLVYYPTDSDGPFPAMILSPGLTASNTDYEVWGRVLASHGIIALLIQPTNVLDWNDARAVDLQAALAVVRGSLNQSGPLAGKIDIDNVGFMGQSMGGGGTLIAANEVGDDIQAAIPMEPYAPGVSFPNITVPTLIIAAELDTVAAVSSNAFAHYNSIPNSTTKIYMEGAGADHYYSTDRYEDDFDMNARYAVAFIKLYLEGDTRYETYLYGDEHEAVASQLSRYLTAP